METSSGNRTDTYPLISVLMGIYNCELTLGDAVKSIIEQTYKHWELIMCDDGSTDGTFDLACRIADKDKRIIVIKNNQNYGLAHTLNHCLKEAKGLYIARMDGDDLCAPERFEKQLYFLISHPEFAICSSSMILFDEASEWGRTKCKKTPTIEDVVTGSPIHHAPAMIKTEALKAVNGYTVGENTKRVEDVDLWIKLYAKGYRCFNLQEPLYSMRNDRKAFQRRKYKYRINSTRVRLKGCKTMHLGIVCYIKSIEPMILGLIPDCMRRWLRKKRGN